MEKIFVDDCSECGKLNTNIEDVCEKLNEIVEWINDQKNMANGQKEIRPKGELIGGSRMGRRGEERG